MAEDVEPIECRCYTLPHRHPLMIGKLPGFQLPFMVTVTQFAVFSIGVPFLFFTRGLWGLLVSGQAAPELAVIVGVPAGAAWALRLARMEGRSPLAMGLGVLSLGWARLSTSTQGLREGRRHREPHGRLFVASGRPVCPLSRAGRSGCARRCSMCPSVGRGWG